MKHHFMNLLDMFFFIEVSMVMAFIVNYGVDFLMEEDTFDYT